MIRASHQYKGKIYGVSWLILRSGSITSRYESFTNIIIIFVDKWSQAHQIYLYRKLANAKETVIANMFATALIARWRYSGRDRLTKVGSADTRLWMTRLPKRLLLKNKKNVARTPPAVAQGHHIYERSLRWVVTIPALVTAAENSKNVAAALKSIPFSAQKPEGLDVLGSKKWSATTAHASMFVTSLVPRDGALVVDARD